MNIFGFLDEHHIVYHDKRLIEQAFIHSSYVNEHRSGLKDNERLEFMGDAVLQIWISVKLFSLKPPLPEGKMTVKRANLVCEKALASYVREFGLNRFLKLGQGEEKTGGRNRDSVIADMFEALTGAIFIFHIKCHDVFAFLGRYRIDFEDLPFKSDIVLFID